MGSLRWHSLQALCLGTQRGHSVWAPEHVGIIRFDVWNVRFRIIRFSKLTILAKTYDSSDSHDPKVRFETRDQRYVPIPC